MMNDAPTALTDRPPATPRLAPARVSTPEELRRDWRIFALAVGVILLMFGVLHNGWWVPAGDSDLYLATARSLVQGRGYRFNGLPVNMAPPGWPFLLAGAMKISTSFSFLKSVNLVLMTGFLGIFYWIVRRFVTSPWHAAAAVVGTGLISHAYELSFWFHSDALFCFLTAASLLVALQVREQDRGWWRVALLAVLCAAAVCVRWAGVLNICIVAGILLDGEWKPRLTRPWIATGLVCLSVAAAFLGLRIALQVTPDELKVIQSSGVFLDDNPRAEIQAYNVNSTIRRKATFAQEVVRRSFGAGRWFSSLFWQPFRLASSAIVDDTGMAVGWFAILLFGAMLAQTWRKRQWIWLGLALPCVVLFGWWPNATARYLVPWTPLILLAILQPLVVFAARGGMWKRVSRALLFTFIISAALCNFCLYSVEAWVAHRPDFYAAYEAGLDQDLINISRYMVDHGAKDNEIAISPRYINMNRVRFSRFGMRAAVLLTDRNMALIPRQSTGDPAFPPQKPTMDWLHDHHIKYYIFQPPISPWRVWHFRLPALQKKIMHQDVVPSASTWQIWEVTGTDPVEINAPPVRGWPRSVPGL